MQNNFNTEKETAHRFVGGFLYEKGEKK